MLLTSKGGRHLFFRRKTILVYYVKSNGLVQRMKVFRIIPDFMKSGVDYPMKVSPRMLNRVYSYNLK